VEQNPKISGQWNMVINTKYPFLGLLMKLRWGPRDEFPTLLDSCALPSMPWEGSIPTWPYEHDSNLLTDDVELDMNPK
jgi:hypothetical protein